METDVLVSGLFGVTLLAGVGIGIWQYQRTQRAKRRGGESSLVTGSYPATQKEQAADVVSGKAYAAEKPRSSVPRK